MRRTPWGVLLTLAVAACGGAAFNTGGEDGGGEGGGGSGSGGSGSGSGGSGGGSSGGSTSSGSASSGGSSGGSASSSGASSGGSGGSTSSGGASSGGSSGVPSDAGGGACTTNAQCGTGMLCGFSTASACAATGSCFPAPGVTCNVYLAGCACDGSAVNLACNGLPSGYAPKPLLHTGACTSGDAGPLLEAGAACMSDTQCAAGLKCCYPCGVAGCSNACVTPTANGTCPLYP